MNVIKSKNNVTIRLTSERWLHITEEHSELAGYFYEVMEVLEKPDYIYEGNKNSKIALKEIKSGKFLVVIYKEVRKTDGFIITAFFTKRKQQFTKKKLLWEQRR